MKSKQLSFFILALAFLQGLLVTQANAGAKPEVVFETSMGSFTLELYPDKAPKTVANFLAYVDDGFYDNTLLEFKRDDFHGAQDTPGYGYFPVLYQPVAQ
jgi:hypothetical protein